MVRYPQFEVLKAALAKAELEEKGVRVMALENTVCEISRIQKWMESFGQFAIYESEDTAIIFNATDILFVDVSGSALVLQLKIAKMPGYYK
jgi:uncharacterized protein (DUF608 family)